MNTDKNDDYEQPMDTQTNAELYDELQQQKHTNKELTKTIQNLTEHNEKLNKQVLTLTKQIAEMQKTIKQSDNNTLQLHKKLDELLTRQNNENIPPTQIPVPALIPFTTRTDKRKKDETGSSSEDEAPTAKKHEQTTRPPTPTQKQTKTTTKFPSPQTQKPTNIQNTTDKTQVPPVILRKQERWMTVQKLLNTLDINYTKAKLTKDGVAVYPNTPQDHRRLTKTLADKGEEYHTFTLNEEKTLRVVIRGIPAGVPPSEVQLDLAQQGYPGAIVQRMASRQNKQEMPLVLVQVQSDQEGILEVNRCCSLVVRVERQKKQQAATQCHRCQRFGHGQSRCTAAPKCVKCGESHSTHECKKPKDTPARCANCAGPHPASYRGCPRYPKTKNTQTNTQNKPDETNTTTPKTQNTHKKLLLTTPTPAPGQSYANVAKRQTQNRQTNTQKTKSPPTDTTTSQPGAAALIDATKRLQDFCFQLTTMMSNMQKLFDF